MREYRNDYGDQSTKSIRAKVRTTAYTAAWRTASEITTDVAGDKNGSKVPTSGRTSAALTRRRDLDLAVAGHSSFYPDVQ